MLINRGLGCLIVAAACFAGCSSGENPGEGAGGSVAGKPGTGGAGKVGRAGAGPGTGSGGRAGAANGAGGRGGSAGSTSHGGATGTGGTGHAGSGLGGSVSLGGGSGSGAESGAAGTSESGAAGEGDAGMAGEATGAGGTLGSGGIGGSGTAANAGTGGSAAAGGSSGSGGVSSACEDGRTQPCCQGGRQTCSAGVWGACVGARISPETCNGVDDDCNGSVDDLGTFSCGVGACATTVIACGPSGLNACVPVAPTTNVDGCDGIDNDCDGAIDEDCASCVRVAPNGDDTAALADANATPFASVQAAVDYAAAHPNGPARVCVAGGATCQNSATYPGPAASDLTMRDGIDVFANYEATTWTRCSAPNTRLAPQTPSGVVFPSAISTPTTLDGFSIDRSTAGTSTAAVTVDGATNVVLSNLVVPANTTNISKAYGIVLQNGAEARVFRSRIEIANGLDEAMGIKSVGSRLYLEDSSGAAPTASQPCATSGNGVVISMNINTRGPLQRGILLESSPGSIIEDSDVCAVLDPSNTAPDARLTAIEIHGDATGTLLHGNRLTGKLYGSIARSALAMTDCAGAAPWIAGNTISLIDSGDTVFPDAIYAGGDCHPLIDSNAAITATTSDGAVAVHCGSQAGVDSRCVISHNPTIGVRIPNGFAFGTPFSAQGTGIQCDGSSCARIDHNSIAGVIESPASSSCAVQVTGWGVQMLQSSAALVTANQIVGMGGTCINCDGIGLSSGGAARIENNFIYGSYAQSSGPLNAPPNECGGVKQVTALSVGGPADVDSNRLSGGPNYGCFARAGSSPGSENARRSYGVEASGGGGTFRNNVMEGCVSFRETSTSSDPVVFQNNALPNDYLDEGANSPNADFSDPRLTATQVNALTDMTASGNISASCFSDGLTTHLATGSACIDRGSSTGAPSVDYDGQARDAAPDIGPDEYVP